MKILGLLIIGFGLISIILFILKHSKNLPQVTKTVKQMIDNGTPHNDIVEYVQSQGYPPQVAHKIINEINANHDKIENFITNNNQK